MHTTHKPADKLPVKINVTGSSTIHHHPEQAILALQIRSEGSSRNLVSSYVTTRSNLLQRHLKELAPKTASGEPAPDAPVTQLSLGTLRSWSTLVRDRNGYLQERVYYGSMDIEVTFRSFSRMGKVVKKLMAEENVEISRIVWQLTEETRDVLGVETRKKAMKDAIRRAQDYAAVIGNEVEPVEITDRESSSIGGARCMVLNTKGTGAGEEELLDLTPPDIEFDCSVNVQFQSAK